MSLFDGLKPQALDPIMAGFQAVNADPRPGKINLGVGMYYDEDGRIPILNVVQKAEKTVPSKIDTWVYLMQDGLPALHDAAKRLVFGSLADTDRTRIHTATRRRGPGAL